MSENYARCLIGMEACVGHPPSGLPCTPTAIGSDSPLRRTGFELWVPPRTTDRWLAPARHPTGCTEASPLPWRGCGFIGHSAG